MEPGRKFSTRTSACLASLRTISFPSLVFRFSAMALFPRLKFQKLAPSIDSRNWSPMKGSIFTISAPMSARLAVQIGPDWTWLKSSTLIPSRGLGNSERFSMLSPSLDDHSRGGGNPGFYYLTFGYGWKPKSKNFTPASWRAATVDSTGNRSRIISETVSTKSRTPVPRKTSSSGVLVVALTT